LPGNFCQAQARLLARILKITVFVNRYSMAQVLL
jgi:hypothetical protein